MTMREDVAMLRTILDSMLDGTIPMATTMIWASEGPCKHEKQESHFDRDRLFASENLGDNDLDALMDWLLAEAEEADDA